MNAAEFAWLLMDHMKNTSELQIPMRFNHKGLLGSIAGQIDRRQFHCPASTPLGASRIAGLKRAYE
jgi:hypothetical protein